MGKYVERAVRVFLNTGTRFPERIVWAIGMVKYSAAKANMELGLLDEKRASAIMQAALEVAEGKHSDKIVVDVFQTGSGTGLNMNVNEVIAERASEIAGVDVHPNDHVNMSQSSNDVIPTAIRLAAASAVLSELVPSLETIINSLGSAEAKYARVVKPGRTHLRDALPVTFGQEMGAFKDAFSKDLAMVREALEAVLEVPLGGTAVGTGINAHPEYPRRAVSILAEKTGIPVKPAASRFRAMRLVTDLAMLTAAVRSVAIDLWRLSQDLRLMYSGPFTGIAEVEIPQEVPGSSMMPGKVNPVTLEAAMQAASYAIALDSSLVQASLLGEFELSMGLPLAGYAAVRQAEIVAEALRKTAGLVIGRVEPRVERMRELAERSQALITLVAPIIGYEKAAEVSRMLYEGRSIREALKAVGLGDEAIEKLLDLEKLVKPGIPSLEVGRKD
ncbi:fumarate hydratase class II [Aeropyrum pernix K1]|uniref:Fumarate hydratase class II n=1 Tax=Aeropyrum pernix (strain ATCC 700893 / DSM 11879 / JCM 9820 / NBRC 100138 / K1) TaxID=272557 RepID=Q9YAX9_AERPE|nr:lyase family protein [Aeropyrum pernix]BAA80819.2 fumarate hydratase class II [Aeropyrum pernix K1]